MTKLSSGIAVVYSDFTVRKVKQTFGIITIEGESFFPHMEPIVPSQFLVDFLAEAFPLTLIWKSEKALQFYGGMNGLGI